MGKLTDMVAEPVSLPDRFKISAKRVRLAGIGLFSKVETERARLYRQIMEMGDSYGVDNGLVGQLTRLGSGTVNLMLEESQRLFDELVEAGEQALAGEQVKPVRPATRIHTQRPVAKSTPKLVTAAKAAQPVAAKSQPLAAEASASARKPAGKKPVLTEVVKEAAKEATKAEAAPAPATELRQQFDAAKARLTTLTAPPDQMTMLTLYALFKQATDGDVTGRRPGPTKLVDRAKFDERHKLKGMTLVEAMERYIATVDRLFLA